MADRLTALHTLGKQVNIIIVHWEWDCFYLSSTLPPFLSLFISLTRSLIFSPHSLSLSLSLPPSLPLSLSHSLSLSLSLSLTLSLSLSPSPSLPSLSLQALEGIDDDDDDEIYDDEEEEDEDEDEDEEEEEGEGEEGSHRVSVCLSIAHDLCVPISFGIYWQKKTQNHKFTNLLI
jgi:hypothetical protein